MSTDEPSSLRMDKSNDGPHYGQEMTSHSHITSHTPFYIAWKENETADFTIISYNEIRKEICWKCPRFLALFHVFYSWPGVEKSTMAVVESKNIEFRDKGRGRSQWQRGLRRGSAASCLLGLWVRIQVYLQTSRVKFVLRERLASVYQVEKIVK
jgi:hypothetical protein